MRDLGVNEPKASLPLSDYKAMRDSLPEAPIVLRRVALPEALKAYLAHTKSSTRERRTPSARVRESGS
jgi:hypothetical protein